MSILINGMQLPKDEVAVIIYSDGDVRTEDWTKYSSIEVPDETQPVEYGEWTAEGNDEYGNYWDECTICRKAVFFPPSVKNDYKYCPHCGAKMDGEDDV